MTPARAQKSNPAIHCVRLHTLGSADHCLRCIPPASAGGNAFSPPLSPPNTNWSKSSERARGPSRPSVFRGVIGGMVQERCTQIRGADGPSKFGGRNPLSRDSELPYRRIYSQTITGKGQNRKTALITSECHALTHKGTMMSKKTSATPTEITPVHENGPEDRKGKLKYMGGSNSDSWNQLLECQVLQTLWVK
jgi:hypothetical protein